MLIVDKYHLDIQPLRGCVIFLDVFDPGVAPPAIRIEPFQGSGGKVLPVPSGYSVTYEIDCSFLGLCVDVYWAGLRGVCHSGEWRARVCVWRSCGSAGASPFRVSTFRVLRILSLYTSFFAAKDPR